MINLYVEEYCQDCPYFTPELKKAHPYMYTNNDSLHFDKYVVCEQRTICQRVQKWYTKKENNHD